MDVYILAVFRSRTQTILFDKVLKSYHIPSSIVNTPDQLRIGCSVAVKLNNTYLSDAMAIFGRRRFDSFVGFYQVRKQGARVSISPITA